MAFKVVTDNTGPPHKPGPKLQFIMERRPGTTTKTAHDFVLYACRGEGRGCPRNKYRTSKKHCEDCMPCPDNLETMGQIVARLRRGDA